MMVKSGSWPGLGKTASRVLLVLPSSMGVALLRYRGVTPAKERTFWGACSATELETEARR